MEKRVSHQIIIIRVITCKINDSFNIFFSELLTT